MHTCVNKGVHPGENICSPSLNWHRTVVVFSRANFSVADRLITRQTDEESFVYYSLNDWKIRPRKDGPYVETKLENWLSVASAGFFLLVRKVRWRGTDGSFAVFFSRPDGIPPRVKAKVNWKAEEEPCWNNLVPLAKITKPLKLIRENPLKQRANAYRTKSLCESSRTVSLSGLFRDFFK